MLGLCLLLVLLTMEQNIVSLWTVPNWGEMVTVQEGKAAPERDHDQLKEWTHRNLERFGGWQKSCTWYRVILRSWESTGECAVEGHKGDSLSGASLQWGKAERAVTVQPGEKKVYQYIYTMQEGCKEERPRLFCVVSIDGTKVMGDFLLNTREHVCYCGDD